jgi:hypothetical protein
MTVDVAYAEWLQSPSRLTIKEDLASKAKWGVLAVDVTGFSSIADEVDAAAEAQRQLDFRSVPVVEEQVLLPKLYEISILRGRVWTIKIATDVAYQTGADVFVLGGIADHNTGVTTLNVLRRISA